MQLEVDAIDVMGGERADTEAERDDLYFSIRDLGLLQPIVVTENPEVPGRFRVVNGRRRLNAIRRLGWPVIDATIRSFTAVQEEMAEISENLHRLDLTPAERDRALRRYRDLFLEQHPELRDVKVEDRLRRDAEAPTGPAESPTGAVAKQFGLNKRTVQKAVKRAEALTDEQRAVLDACHLKLDRIDRIAAIPDAGHREAIVNLIASNMDYDAAMGEVLGDAWEGIVDDDDDLSDEEFLESLKVRRRVNQQRFDADALLYRRVQQQRIAFTRAIDWSKLRAEVGARGLFFRRLALLLDCKHPRDWMVCHNCVRGQSKGGQECLDCRGGGYLLG